MGSAEAVVICALGLVGRSRDTFPPIELLDSPPPIVSAHAQGFVIDGLCTVYLITSTPAFRAARSAPSCGSLEALRMLASALIHEEWHLAHGVRVPRYPELSSEQRPVGIAHRVPLLYSRVRKEAV